MKYEGNTIIIGDYQKSFSFNIRKVVELKGYFVILLSIPFNNNSINNIYGINEASLELWRVEKNTRWSELPYENISISSDGNIFATDFYGRGTIINKENGMIVGYKMAK